MQALMLSLESRIQVRRYSLPFRGPVRTAHGVWGVREGVFVRIEGADGSVGFGEAAPVPGFSAESVDEIEAAARGLGETATEAAFDALPAQMACLRGAIRAARRDREQVPGRPSLGVAALLPAGAAALTNAPQMAEAGFRVFKWKVGVGDPADELALLDDLCAALPSTARLRLDANGGWDRRRAERWLERCAERPVEFVEQPVAREARGSEDLLQGLARDYPVPIALDESVAGDGDIERWLGMGWPGIFVIKPALLGEADATLGLLAAARAPVVFSSALETGIGARASLFHAFRWEGEPRALGFGAWPLFSDARFDGPAAAPFVRWEDVERIDPEAIWNAAG